MRILYSLPHPWDRLGSSDAGHTVRAMAILNALEKLGNEVIVIEAAQEQKGSKAAVNTYRRLVKKLLPIPIAMRLRDAGRIAFGERYARRLLEKINVVQPDILLETHIAFSRSGKIASEQSGVPYVLDDVTPSWEEDQLYGVGLKRRALRIHREVTKQARLLVTVNQTLYKHFLDEGHPKEKLVVVENGIAPEYFNEKADGHRRRKELGIGKSNLVIVFVGSFQPNHIVDLLLKAFAQLKRHTSNRLLLVGQGRETAAAKATARELGLMNQVIFTGSVPYQDVSSYIAAADIAIIPATNQYNNSMKVYEYLALSKTVLAPDQPNITDIVTHGKDAFLFEQENIPSMTAALQKVIVDSFLRQKISLQASAGAKQHTWEKRACVLLDAIQNRGIV